MNKFTFVIIGYNIENYVERAIESVVEQTYKNIEIIFVNDGSTDNTLDKVEKYSNNNKIKIINQSNKGANAARKKGLENATGEYVFFIDGDDWVSKTLAEDMNKILSRKLYDIVCFRNYIAYDDKIKECDEIYKNYTMENFEYLEAILSQTISHSVWNKVYKRVFLEKSNFNKIDNITMGDDLLINVSLGIYKPNVFFSNEAYYYYYQRMTSITKKSTLKVLEIKNSLESIEKILSEKELLGNYIEFMNNLWFKHCFFERVVRRWHENSEVKKIIYNIWKEKNIDLYSNNICNEFISKQKLSIKIITKMYNYNYNIADLILKPIKILK